MYLSKIYIKNYRGISKLTVDFNSKLNVIIGANGQMKTALIDAIRLFYSWREPNRDLEITKEDFHVELEEDDNGNIIEHVENQIDIVYIFEGISDAQRGAYYQYLEQNEDGKIWARVHLKYELKEKGRIFASYTTGKEGNGIKADWETFSYFHPYYLGALRDSTRDLLSTRNNLIGRVIARKIANASSEDDVKKIINDANDNLLQRQEVRETNEGINDNLKRINQRDKVGLHIEQNKIEYIVNVIKPFLPYSDNTKDGFLLTQNSLGFNNLIYIASVLSDIKDCHDEDPISIYALLIEEPEAHLHPQLQVNLYDFLKDADKSENSQTFITTHSPTLTSKIPLENLILLRDNKAFNIASCFKEREVEKIKKIATPKEKALEREDVDKYRKMIARYLDVTRSQLLFSNGCLFIEGVSECQLMESFSKLMGKSLIDHQIELVNTVGTAFYQFMMLFNSSDEGKRLPIKAAFVTDEDQFTDSKSAEYKLESLIANNYAKLATLRDGINNGKRNGRVDNMNAMANGQTNIKICTGVKTLEYQICLANVSTHKDEITSNWLYQLVKEINEDGVAKVDTYLDSLGDRDLNEIEMQNTAILLWKCLSGKAEFAQTLGYFIYEKIEKKETVRFNVPSYIREAINFLIPDGV